MKKVIIFILTIGFCLAPVLALADGMILPPPNYNIYGTDQKAVIFYENNTETLILSTTFRGNAKNFGWIVPTPSRPEVSRSSDEIFTSLEDLTRVETDYQLRPLGLSESYTAGMQKNDVYVVETKKVEYYDISVLEANDSGALVRWLNENNYYYPERSSYIFDSYINNKWYFTAVKIDASLIGSSVSNAIREGHMIPLQLKFKTDKIVYPMRISSAMEYVPYPTPSPDYGAASSGTGIQLNPQSYLPYLPRPYYYPSQVGVLIYVFTTANKQTLPGFTTNYAGWIKKDTIKDLAFDENGNPSLNPGQDKYFLTKLTRWMSYSEMTSDLYLRNAADNNLVNAKPLEGENSFWFWFLMAIGVLLILGVAALFIILAKK